MKVRVVDSLHRFISSFLIIFLISVGSAFVSMPTQAMAIVDKNQNDVYSLLTVFRQQVTYLLNENGLGAIWPAAGIQHDKQPRQVYQKALDLISKIDRYRRLKNLGPIAKGHMPGRAISSNEVFDLAHRLVDELNILLPVNKRIGNALGNPVTGKTSNDTFKLLSEAGVAFDMLTGEHGIEPTDVYARSLLVLKEVQFLNTIQPASPKNTKPNKPSGKHSNHALEAVTSLLLQIAKAQQNLWMEPVAVPDIPRRVIKPIDVYNSMDIVLGELLRIKYRLGRERNFVVQRGAEIKTPDDVIQVINWAEQLMPLFSPGNEINQSSQLSLVKDTNHVYSLSNHIIKRLIKYNQEHGIQKGIRMPHKVEHIVPRHVFQETIKCIEKLNLLRRQNGLEVVAPLQHPLRVISMQDMFESVLRLEQELNILFELSGMHDNSWLTSTEKEVFHDKTASDVYQNIHFISKLLDAGISQKAFTIEGLYAVASRVLEEVKIFSQRFDQSYVGYVDLGIVDQSKIKKQQVYAKGQELLKVVLQAQQRGGLVVIDKQSTLNAKDMGPSDLYNLARLVLDELVELKLHLGIREQSAHVEISQNKLIADVYMLLEESRMMLTQLIEGKKHKNEN